MSMPRSYLPKRESPELKASHFHDDDFSEQYPALAQLLGLAQDEQGKPREPASITLFVGEGKLKAAVNDKHTKMTFWTTLTGSSNVLADLDTNVQKGHGEWKASKEGWVLKK